VRSPPQRPRGSRGRAELLAALVEVALASGDVDAARAACADLGAMAGVYDSGGLPAAAAYAAGCVTLAGGEPVAALPALRRAVEGWQEVGAPYERARARALVARACSVLGDKDTATSSWTPPARRFGSSGRPRPSPSSTARRRTAAPTA